MLRVLVVDDDRGLRMTVKAALPIIDHIEVEEAVDGIDALKKIKASRYNLVLLDVDMPHMTGLEALKKIKEYDPSIIVIILTAYANVTDAVTAVKEGAYNYLSKPIQPKNLVETVNKALSAHSLISDMAASNPTLTTELGRKIIGNAEQMQKVFHIINRLSKVSTPVLVRGPSGTGKELVARAVHMNSPCKEGKFVAINCSSIPNNLFESELFGHEKGAFTGADQRKIGKFQYAEGGTLFLDEAGDLPMEMQVKLLRVLQEKTFTPVGSNREIDANVRIIAATNRNLEDMIEKNEFREDLYYRLNVMPISLPALKERKEDIGSLVAVFIRKLNKKQDMKIIGLAPEVMALFQKYNWPGNIRELENVIEYAFILEDTQQITLRSLPEAFLAKNNIEILPTDSENKAASNNDNLVIIPGDRLDFSLHKEAFEKEFIIKALKAFNGRINQTAIHANIPKKTLLRKINKYKILTQDYKS